MMDHTHPTDNHADALLERGHQEHARKDLSTAVTTSRSVLILRPDSIDAWFLLARVLNTGKRWNAARVSLERLALLNPLGQAHRRLHAKLLLTLRMHSKAWHAARSLVVQNPADAEGWEYLARGRALLGRSSEVARFLVPLNCLRPNDPSVAVAFSRSMMETRHLNQAETWCRTAIQRGGENAERYLDLARILRAKGDLSGSETMLDRATMLNPRMTLRARAVRLTVTDADFARPDTF